MLRKNNLFSTIENNLFVIIYGIIAMFFFLCVFKLQIPTDVQLHNKILSEYLGTGSFPNPPLYYFSIYLLNIFFNNNFVYAAIVILSIVSVIKFILVKYYLMKNEAVSNLRTLDFFVFTLMFLSPIFLFNLDYNFYLGKFTSTIWHNSTTIFVFPLCIWLFLQSLSYLKKPGMLLIVKMLIISLLILLTKPNFLFAFIVAFPLICMYKFGLFNKWFSYVSFFCLLVFAALILQKKIIYTNGNLDKLIYNGEKSNVIIAPFKVWLAWSKYPISNFLTSFAFILSFMVLKFRSIKKDIEILFSLLLLAISLIVFFMLAESGARFWHGNFYWQIPISMLITNMVFLKKTLLPDLGASKGCLYFGRLMQKDKVILFFYSMQFLSGIFYFVQIIRTKSYF